jgi:N-acyl-phosphatidylethanolamine-hydrolysing phospholipase D
MPSLHSWLLVVPLGIGGAAFFEHFRYLITHRHRNKKLRDFWEPEQLIPTPKPYGFWQTLGEYLLLPLTYAIGWIEPTTQIIWKQKFFHSLNVAGRFVNPFIEWEDRNTTDIFAYIKWQMTRKNRNGVPRNEEELAKTLPLLRPNFELLFQKSNLRRSDIAPEKELSESWHVESSKLEDSITVTWIGQSTCFVQMDGYNILTDPIFSNRTMGEWFGPKRLRPAPCQLADLPPIDIVLISHNHYDHLDSKSMEIIGNSATWYVPLGMKSWFNSYGIDNVLVSYVVRGTRLVGRVHA